MAVELRVPVVPMYIEGSYRILPKGKTIPRPARVSIHIGRPVTFSKETSYMDATRAIEEAVKALRDGGAQ